MNTDNDFGEEVNDAGEDLNVQKIHGSIMREHDEPYELFTGTPWWLKYLFYAPLTIFALSYYFTYSGGWHWNEYSELPQRTVVPEPGSEGTQEKAAPTGDDPAALLAAGKEVYTTVCSVCHQPDGKGLPGAFPPLAGSDWVEGEPDKAILSVVFGLGGEITVSGEKWNSMMPPQGLTLDDTKIAAVLTYVRSEWGNTGDAVSPDTVAALREKYADHEPWTEETLEAALAE